MSYSYTTGNLTNLGQLKKLAQRAKQEIDSVSSRVTTLETAGYIPESSIDAKISAAVAGALQPAGSIAFASLPELVKANCNKIYNITDAFETTSDFVEGAGKSYPAGTNVAIIDVGSGSTHTYKYDTYTGTFDFSGFVTKKTSAVTGNFGAFDANGDLIDSGHKHSDYLTAHQDISGKADKVASATSGNFAGLDSEGNLTDSGSKAADFAAADHTHTDKADKPVSATSGNVAKFDSNKNPVDAGFAADDVVTKIASPTADNLVAQTSGGKIADAGIAKGDVVTKIASPTNNNFVLQDANGKIKDAGYALATDTNVEDMIHDVWGDPET